MDFRQNSEDVCQLVFGIIGPIGCNRKLVLDTIDDLAGHYGYKTVRIGVSDVITKSCVVPVAPDDQYLRVTNLMKAGNEMRKRTSDNSILAKLAAAKIAADRKGHEHERLIFVIDSIKHPEEVEELRNIYGPGFLLFAVHSSEERRNQFLQNQCHISDEEKRKDLIERDKDEKLDHGQSTSDAFHLADFFLVEEGNHDKVWAVMNRFFDIIFGDPFRTPTFHEYAMFMAYSASMRSADMSRQVGAVVTSGTDILSTGANECPAAQGGTYWPTYNPSTNEIFDAPGGRDYTNNVDPNGQEKQNMLDEIMKDIPAEALAILERNIKKSGLSDISEFGRVVHAEMDAILGCARRGVSCQGSTIFCTTFPCHNCAKHIVASGIKKVLFIEPYPKSKAYALHPDSICNAEENDATGKVVFSPFVGVGPRQFVNLFSLTLTFGQKIKRKKLKSFEKAEWSAATAQPRLKVFPTSYEQNEKIVEEEAAFSLSKIEKVVII
jgi:deoxycytidylate deaminase